MPGTATEADLIAILQRLTPVNRRDVVLGIGDDAALAQPPAGMELALAMDTLVSGVHFPRETPATDVGWKALAVNLSDLAAMGATPAWAMVSLTLPKPDAAWLSGFAEGFAGLAAEYEVALLGGDTTGGPLSVTVQVAGFVEPGRALLRSGARPGDGIYVTGTLGDAAAALAAIQGQLPMDQAGPLRDRLDRPRPRVPAGRALRGLASACIDLSDGLAVDLARVLGSSGCGGAVELERLPASGALTALVPDAGERRGFQVAGDDYELCFTAGAGRDRDIENLADELDLPMTRVGEVRETGGLDFTVEGRRVDPPGPGWRHFGGSNA